MRQYSYEAKIGGNTYYSMYVHDDGRWEFSTLPPDVTRVAATAFMESFDRDINRMIQHGLTDIEVKKL